MNEISIIHYSLLGVAVGALLGMETMHVATAVMYLLIPILIYSAAINIHVDTLREVLRPVILLATVGVIFTAIFVAVAMWWLIGMEFKSALIFGAAVSTTDPVAVVGLFNEMKTDRKLTTLVDCESLFNDATALVLFTALLSYGMVAAAPMFIAISTASFALGWFSTYLVRPGVTHFELGIKVLVLFAITTLSGMSGIFAVTGFGIHMTELKKDDHVLFYDVVARYYNAIVFFLCGSLAVFLMHVTAWEALVAISAVVASRWLIVWALVPDNKIIAWWGGGIRGILPLIMVLSLPENFPDRADVVSLTCAVILFSLVVQGGTVKTLLKQLEITRNSQS